MVPDGRIRIGTDLLPGVDWRGNGGYVVGPGSRVNGACYTIARNKPLARAPEALLERLRARKTLARPVKDASGHMVIPDGQRNETLFAMACLQRRFGIEFNAILAALRAANADHCEPPLPDEDLRKIAASAMRYKHTPRDGEQFFFCAVGRFAAGAFRFDRERTGIDWPAMLTDLAKGIDRHRAETSDRLAHLQALFHRGGAAGRIAPGLRKRFDRTRLAGASKISRA